MSKPSEVLLGRISTIFYDEMDMVLTDESSLLVLSTIQNAIDSAVADERERCARIATLCRRWGSQTASGDIADMIRALPKEKDDE
ncbi:MAG: hypothetical protein QQN63_10330 [Nitrosopumilus sp.]